MGFQRVLNRSLQIIFTWVTPNGVTGKHQLEQVENRKEISTCNWNLDNFDTGR